VALLTVFFALHFNLVDSILASEKQEAVETPFFFCLVLFPMLPCPRAPSLEGKPSSADESVAHASPFSPCLSSFLLTMCRGRKEKSSLSCTSHTGGVLALSSVSPCGPNDWSQTSLPRKEGKITEREVRRNKSKSAKNGVVNVCTRCNQTTTQKKNLCTAPLDLHNRRIEQDQRAKSSSPLPFWTRPTEVYLFLVGCCVDLSMVQRGRRKGGGGGGSE